MTSSKRELWPVKVIYFFLSCVGFGIAKTKKERRLLNISLGTFFVLSTLCIYFSSGALYLGIKRGVFSDIIAVSFPLVTATLTHFKLIVFALQRTSYERLLQLTKETLWIQWWTEYGKLVLKQCERRARMFLFIFVILGHASGAGWVFEPLLLTMRGNSSDPNDRHLPTEAYLGVPLYESPYYEVIFVADVFGVYTITVLYFCFDYYLVLVNIFIVGQFEILRKRYEELYVIKENQQVIESDHDNGEEYLGEFTTMEYIHISKELKNCVKQHQFLISLVDDIEAIYNVGNLAQVLMLSLIICVVGYSLLMPVSVLTLVKNGVFIGSCFVQLFTFTLSCHNIMIASSDVGNGIYFNRWYHENHTEKGRSLSKSGMLILMKTKYPCYLTACGFFPITLDTFKSVATTAFSYLTLMRQGMEE